MMITQVKERKMAIARINAPQGLMNTESKSRLVKEGARALKAALGVGWEEDDTGIFTICVEIDDGQWGVGAKIPMLAISSEARSLSADAMKCSACSPNVWPRDLLCRRNEYRPSGESMISRVRQLAVGYGLNVV